jgi:hypothetical protein
MKNWNRNFIYLVLLSLSLIVLINYLVNPFNVFDHKVLIYDGQPNERFTKINYLIKNNKKYNSYILGSSRSGILNPVLFNTKKGDKFYNLSVSSCTVYDIYNMVEYIVNNFDVKSLIIQIDPDIIFHNFKHSETDFLRLHHPFVTDESIVNFKSKYLLAFYPKSIKDKILTNYYHNSSTRFNIENGTWSLTETRSYISPQLIEKNQIRNIYKNQNLKVLTLLINHMRKAKIKYTILIPPLNHVSLTQIDLKSYQEFIDELSQITPLLNFCFYNSFTLNDSNYYDLTHYKDYFGIQLQKFISQGNSDNELCKYVDSNNSLSHLSFLEFNFNEYRK